MQALTEKPALTAEEVRRLTWRCRRGLLELDIVLQRFADHDLPTLSQAELLAFDHLLSLPDNEFLELITKRTINLPLMEIAAMKQVLAKISAV